jgi:hypothetical protein
MLFLGSKIDQKPQQKRLSLRLRHPVIQFLAYSTPDLKSTQQPVEIYSDHAQVVQLSMGRSNYIKLAKSPGRELRSK